MPTAAAILAVLLEQPTYDGDKNDLPDARIALYAPYADAIADVAKDDREAAVLESIALHESHLARYVLENRCSEGPPGERCDNGRARGAWQLHRAACKEAWTLPWGSEKSLRVEAHCVLSLYYYGQHRCHSARGAYGIYAGASCSWSGAASRYRLAGRLQAQLVVAGRRDEQQREAAGALASGAD